MRKIWAFVFVLFISNVAVAEEIDKKFFKDLLGVSDLLRTKGIDPSSLNWVVITPMCLPLKTPTDETIYNKCMYEKAMDSYQWRIDYSYCTDKSEQKYPDSLMYEKKIRSYVITSSDGAAKSVDETVKLYNSRADLARDKKMAYQDCMNDKNWKDIGNWQFGKNGQ